MRITRGMIGQRVYNSNRKVGTNSGSAGSSSLLKALNERITQRNRQNGTAGAGSSTGAARTTLNKLKTEYTSMRKAAQELQEHAQKLLEGGEDSLFAKAAKSGDTGSVVNEIGGFIDEYNAMYEKMDSLGGNVNESYRKQLDKFVSDNKAALKEVGITLKKDGTLSVNQKTLKAAGLEQLKALFGEEKSFAAKVNDKAGNAEGNADANLNAISASGYTSYGSGSSSNYGSYGSRYNARG